GSSHQGYCDFKGVLRLCERNDKIPVEQTVLRSVIRDQSSDPALFSLERNAPVCRRRCRGARDSSSSLSPALTRLVQRVRRCDQALITRARVGVSRRRIHADT
ncbi:hypothetical protein M9458_022691, partial [Cirrhinus mrigala]